MKRIALTASIALLLALSAAAQGDEIVQKGNLQVSTAAKMRPERLPRKGTAPISVSVAGHISTTDESLPPQLKRLEIDINRHGRLDFQGLPSCSMSRIQPASTEHALAACRSALVGEGTFWANIVLQGQPPYPTQGRLLVFNGKEGRRQVLLGHIYTAEPFTNSFVITFKIKSIPHGQYGTALIASLPEALGTWGYVTGIEMTLRRRWHFGGRSHSYLSAGCPAPKGFPGAVFPLTRTTFSFAGGTTLASTLMRSCRAKN